MAELRLVELINNRVRTHSDFVAELEKKQRNNAESAPVFVNNGTIETKTSAKNKFKSIKTDKDEIVPGEIVTYTVSLDESNEDTIIKDLGKVNFCFWLQKKNSKGKIRNIHLSIIAGLDVKKTDNSRINAVLVRSRGDGSSLPYKKDFTNSRSHFTRNIVSHAYYYAKIEIDKKEKKVHLKIKFAKWMDEYKIRVETYLHGDELKGDGGKTTVSRYVKATPEIIDAFWVNAEWTKIMQAGYNQDLYLNIQTLGLKGKTIDLRVYDHDNDNNDDQIEWKNNIISIDKRQVVKQFKIGNKERYKEALKDDYYVTGLPSFLQKMELYIKIMSDHKIKLYTELRSFGKINLINTEIVNSAFFSKTKKTIVQADSKPSEKYKNPKRRVKHYRHIDNGFLDEKISLVASCSNLEGKELTFKLYDKQSLIAKQDAEVIIIYKDKEVTEIKAKVKDGYAVAEIELKYKKKLKDNKDWLDVLKNGYDKTGGTAELYIKTEVQIKSKTKVDTFLEDKPFELIRNNWHEPVDDPQIAIYNQYGKKKAKSNTFGKGRGRFHSGLDIFCLEGSDVYACLDAVVYEIQKWTTTTGKSGYGHNITLKINNPAELRNRRREYTKQFTTDLKEKSNFDEDSNVFLLRYAHLSDVLVKKGQRVKAGDVIGKSGISGVIAGTKDPHLHFNIYSDKKISSYLVNPAYYVYWKEVDDLTDADKKIQKDRMKKGTLKNAAPKLSKL